MGAGLSTPDCRTSPKIHKVQLVATAFGPRIPGIGQAYHTSVVIDGIEYSFSAAGIVQNRGIQTHIPYRNTPEIFDCGMTHVSGRTMRAALRKDFQRNSYDLLRKNCNSFSECALFMLCDRHLDDRFRIMEKIGRKIDHHTTFITLISGGAYRKNPAADRFDTLKVQRGLHAVLPDDRRGRGEADAQAAAAKPRRRKSARKCCPGLASSASTGSLSSSSSSSSSAG
mmetsp:Transcript_7530/g.22162  ORF Transcript_7530/g.22162 Transcript_7530/m.22162 type:complete len:226 (-) Transcript_7530:146-823(-)